MRVRIFHETRYDYDDGPQHVVQRLHLQPADFAGQSTINWTINAPGMDKALCYRDGFGNWVHLITASGQSGSSIITASGDVDTSDTAGVVRGLTCAAPEAIFLRQTPFTQPDSMMAKAANVLKASRDGLSRGHELMGLVVSRVAYETGVSHSQTTAAEAFRAGRGVCQDHAHVLVGLARSLGIPARYVTGYLVTGVGATSVAGHAWAELLVPDLGWVGFDAANGQCPTADYVRLASGLDAAQVAPVRGTRRGASGHEQMTVEVRVEIDQQ
jgi:transglutaminase-like putative cysteine protease